MKEIYRPSISVVIPAYNEEDAVGSQVEAIHEALESHGFVYEIIVIDDGSEDQTAQEALAAHALGLLSRGCPP